MAYLKRSSWVILVFTFAFVLGGFFFRAFSQEGARVNFSSVEMDIEIDKFVFFDQNTGRVYVHNNTDGKLRELWQLDRVGALRKFTKRGEVWQ